MIVTLARGIKVVAPEGKPVYPYGNCLYIEDDRPTVIDLGAGGRAFAAIPCEQVRLGLISHFHFDHLHGDSFFPQAEFMAGWEEGHTYSDPAAYLNFHGYDQWEIMMPGQPREAYGSVIPLPEDVPVQPGFRPVPLAGMFKDGDTIPVGKRILTTVHLPGHTAGHYGFYLEQESILFSGDIDLVANGPWYSSNSADVGDLIASVNRIREINPRVVVPSHRRVQTENIGEQLDRYIQVVLDRQSRIYDLLKSPHSLFQLAEYGLVFPQPHNLYEVFWERMTIRNHLHYLQKTNAIIEIEPGLYQQKSV